MGKNKWKKIVRIKSHHLPACKDPILGITCQYSVIRKDKIVCPFKSCNYERCLNIEQKIAVLVHVKRKIANLINYYFGPPSNWKQIPDYSEYSTPENAIVEKILEIIVKGG